MLLPLVNFGGTHCRAGLVMALRDAGRIRPGLGDEDVGFRRFLEFQKSELGLDRSPTRWQFRIGH